MSLNRQTLGTAPLEIIDGDRGASYPQKNDFMEQGFCLFLNTGNVTPTGFSFDKCQFISEAKDAELRKGKLLRGDVVLTTRGTIGNSALFGKSIEFDQVRINSGMVILRADNKRLTPEYLYLYLRSRYFKDEVERLRSGAAQPQLPIRDLKQAIVEIPPILEQDAITEKIWQYDDLIETNRRRIVLLEESARLLYREWFMNLRFPGHGLNSIDDGLPSGWTRQNLYEVADLTMGYPFQSSLFNVDQIGRAAIRIRDIPDVTPSTWTTEDPGSPSYEVLRGDFLIGMDGFFHMNHWTGEPAWLVQRVCRVRPKNPIYRGYLALALNDPIKHFEATISGATVAHLGAKHLKTIEIAMPSMAQEDALIHLNNLIDQKIALVAANSVATKARDMLLPKLMSGEIQV